MLRSRLALPGLVVALACGSPTDPSEAPRLEFSHRVLFGVATQPVAAIGGDGVIRLSAVFQTPRSGYTLLAVLTVEQARSLNIVVQAVQTMTGFPFPTQNYYEGTIRGLTEGDYELTVVHFLRDSPPTETTVYRQTITVR
ncbi:MAG: hypothetical protein ACRENB_00865 [Gemmatimonadales bacterium]